MLTTLKSSLRICSALARVASITRSFAGVNKQVVRTQAKAPENLARVLNNELQFEKQKYKEFIEAEEFLKQSGFTLVESPETVEIKLLKNVGDKIVEIKYQATEAFNEEGEEEETEGEEKKGEKEGEEGDDNIKSSTDFMVTVRNPDGSGLFFDCNSHDTQLSIYHAGYSKNVEELVKGNLEKETGAYLGPSFDNLDEKVQQSFMDYLESLGITDRLLAYIECSAMDKEQRLYMKWLNEVKNFLTTAKQQLQGLLTYTTAY
eukprot:TRINITY_DN1003_c0_g1_i1.p8 TRINITY_DN1003_c0_g1~~TRINITY_DN1003_c0_g1_i1.p8  ORF type:complete len:261 (-),score=43.67 TRINITY_DN1003_c0_g1_i1:2684-3466(-)